MVERVVPAEVRLAEYIRALRRGAGAAWPGPASELGKGLLTDLLQQPDDTEPIEWLGRERAQPVAVLALGLVLHLAGELSAGPPGLPASGDSDRKAAAAYLSGRSGLYGALVARHAAGEGIEWNIADIAESTVPASLQRLRAARQLSGLPPELQPQMSVLEPTLSALLADLLRLDDGIDVVQWLQQERSGLTARIGLGDLVRSTIPNVTTIRARHRLRSNPFHAQTVSLPALKVAVTAVDLLEHGFGVEIRARFSAPDRDSPEAPLAMWEGFERVFDDRGRAYVAQIAEQQVSRSPWPLGHRWRQRLVLVCAPALDLPAVVTLESPRAALAAYRHGSHTGEMIAVPSPVLGHVSSRISL